MQKQLTNQFGLDKATLILINTVGMPIARQITVQRSEIVDGHLILQYIEKGKRKPHGTIYDTDTELALYAGWHEVSGAINTGEAGEWEQFGEGDFARMAASIKAEPVYKQDGEAE